MEELIKQLVEKVGIDNATATRVSMLLKENAADVPKALAGGPEAVGQFVGKFGVDPAIATKIAAFLLERKDDVLKWLGADAPGFLGKAVEKIGGLFGKKE